MRNLAFVTASLMLLLGIVPSIAQNLPHCAVGMELPTVCCTNYPGTILAADEDNGVYQVRQKNGLIEWMGADMLRRSCTGAQPKPVTEAFFVGKWSTFVPPYPRYDVIGGKNYLVVGPGAAAFPIEIKADGTYSWMVNRQPVATVTGHWHVLAPSDYKYGTRPNNAPVILLANGQDGVDWYVSRKVPVGGSENVHQVHIEQVKLGLTQSGTRMR